MHKNGAVPPVLRIRSFIAFLCIALALCVIGLRGARSQSPSLRRITTTSEDGVSLNPSLSGDGRRMAFESTEDLAHAGGSEGFRALRATLSSTSVSLTQMGATRAVAPAISQDGSRIAFASKDNPLGANQDGNSEIFFFDGGSLRQITNTSPGDISLRLRNGNFQPSITDDARFIAFSSNRDLAGLNSDGNLEIFIYDTAAQSFTQLTNTAGTIGATDAKISGDGTRVAYIRDSGTITGSPRDLVLEQRKGGAPRVIAAGVLNLWLTYGRAISDNGLRVVYSAPVRDDSPQVLLYDGQTNSTRQITTLAAPGNDGDVPLHPTISGDGSRIAFATRRNVNGGNSDDSVELYIFRIATGQFTRITSAPSSASAAVVSSLSDDGSLVAFNFPRVLSGAVSSSGSANNCEIYIANTSSGTEDELIVLNGASFGHEPSSTKAVAPDSIAVALGDALANTILQAQRLPDGTFPLSLGGLSVTVNNRPAQIFSVSPERVTFLVPPATETGTAQVDVTNSAGSHKRATGSVLVAAPGVFTRGGDGLGPGFIVDAVTGQFGPFDPTGGTKRLLVSATGVRNASEVSVTIGGRFVTVEAITPSAETPGLDLIRILLPADLSGVGTVDLVVRADDRASNPATVTLLGQPRRDIIINEVLADPPADLAGDANHDGVRDSSDDEFVELVNSTTRDLDISGYQIFTHSASASEDTLRHTFAPGTIFPAGTSIVVFGGGSPPVNNVVFGGAQIFTASKDGSSSSSLSLTNAGGVITVRESTGALVAMLSYGGTTGLEGDQDQSLTRSPDIAGDFVPHQSAQGSGGRSFSPGTRADGTPFAATPAIARIQVSPASANIGTGARQQFTAHAFNTSGQELTGIIFRWQSSAPVIASIDQNGLATARAPGTTEIRVSARGVQSIPATLTVFFQAQVLTRIEVTPASASIPPGGQQQYAARALDQNDNEITGVTFSWSSSDETIATVDQGGLATALHLGTATIKATAQGITGSATLRVIAPVLVINEVLADPPGSAATDTDGDANHDGVRSSSQDEFIELVNSSNAALDISGWTVSTRSLADSTERTRHTFEAATMLPAHAAMVVFGGGDFDPGNPLFGCAQVVKASAGRLSLTNTGLHVMVRDANGNLFAQLTYGSAVGLNGGSDQSLTRSPDITGNFVRHTEAAGASGRKFSPGTKVDGSPLGQCQGRLTSVRVTPTSASVIIGRTTQFTAQAFDQFGQPLTGMTISFTSSNTNVATVESVSTNQSTGVATATIKGRNLDTAQITARATDGTIIVTSSPATLTVMPVPPRVTRIEVTPPSAAINRGGTQQFTARAFNQNTAVSGITFTWTSSDEAVATVDAHGRATGVGSGTVTMRATAPDGVGGMVSDDATLDVQVPLVINELLADVPSDDDATPVVEGDANRDGVRDSGDDEFIELLNNSNSVVDISGVIISDLTRNRFTFPANTTLAAGRAVVVFGGGSPPVNDPSFGGALVLKASSLGLNDSGDMVTVKLPVAGTDVTVAMLAYGEGSPTPAPSNRSLTRSPDAERGTTGGDFIAHPSAANAAGRIFSPGTRIDGTPFGSLHITRIQVTPPSATLNIGGTKSYTARAFSNSGGSEVEVQNVSFIWDASDPGKALVNPTTGTMTMATALSGGSATIRAQAGGQQGTARLNINFPPISRILVTPASASIPLGGQQQFTARAFDASNQEIAGITFTWASSNENVGEVDQNGLATAANLGTAKIKATAQDTNGTATLRVITPQVVINEVLADPPGSAATDTDGDANHDGERSSSQDEFVELVNTSNAAINISGWSLLTHSLDETTETTRHTFTANTTLPAGKAMVVFGGGTIDSGNPAFGGAQVVKASSGRLSLTNSGLAIVVRDANGNLFAQFTYGGSTGLNGGSDQSLTRSPDASTGTAGGNFVKHTTATKAAGRAFSPGTRVDGTPFGSPSITRIQVTPSSDTINTGATKTFTARAFSNSGGPEVEVQNVSFTWDSSATSKATVAPTTGASTVATGIGGGSVTIRAQAGGQQGTARLNINFPPVSRTQVTPASARIPLGGTQQFTGRAFDANNQEITGITFTWASSNTNVATIDQNGLATAIHLGSTTITARAQDASGTASLRVIMPQVVINEVLADPPGSAATDTDGDANHDGVRDSGDDEFVELVNTSNAAINISGWSLRTLSSDETAERLRHTFAANTTLPAGKAMVVFGGGQFDPSNPVFGGAQVVKASSGRLSLTNSGLTVIVRDAGGNFFAQFTYGGTTGLNGGSDQSLTRSPDASTGTAGGNFVKHTTAANAAGRVFSPGTRTDGTPFGSPPITRIEVMPPSATINVGATQAFSARAFSNSGGPEVEVQNISFIWDASDTSKATVSPATGKTTTATGVAGGSAVIRARAGGQQGAAALTINFLPISRIVVTPASAKAPIGGQQQFTARAFDASNQEISGVTFTWSSSKMNVGEVDQNGLATAVNLGTATITATAPNASASSTLNVVARTVVINEVLADPPDDAAGDANHDGVRDSGDDEFVEFVNALSANVNISGWSIRTRSSTGTTENLRHTFAANTTLPAHDAIVIFGGGTFDPDDPTFGGAQVVKASSGRLSLTNTGLNIIVRDGAGNLVTQFTYGGSTTLNGGSNQSLTRSPDVTGSFVLHTMAAGAGGRRFSPGRKLDGSFFVPRTGHLTSVDISPASESVIVNRTTQFTAQAFDQFGQPLTGITITFASDNTSVVAVDSVSTNPGTGVATAVVRGRHTGTAHITSQATDGTNTVTSSPATLTVTPVPPRVTRIEVAPQSASINRGATQQFTAQAFNQNSPVSGITFTWTSSNADVATVDANGLARGVGMGTVTITATAPDGVGGTVSDDATLTARVPLVINELLADPSEGAAGDANRDGTRDGTQDEFVELVNDSNSPVDISGVQIADATSNRFNFPANTTLAAGRAILIFGGGTPPASDPNFGGALVFKTGSGGLSLNNSGDTVNVKLAVAGTDVSITTVTYGAEGDDNQSLTRSPDLSGAVTKHSAAQGSNGRIFSPGERTDGTPFGSPSITRIEVAPTSATINTGGTQTFTARAFSNASGPELEIQNVSFIWDASDTSKATVAPTTGQSTVATGISGGSATIRARAGGQEGTAALTINFSPISRIEVMPASATITVGGTQQFMARAFDANNQEITGVTFNWTSSDLNVATIDQNGLATSANIGMTTIKASAQGMDGAATLNVVAPTVIINEALADPPDGLAGDANHDGVRGGADDEFIELVNSGNAGIDISGWSIRTRSSTGTTENLRHTFAASTTLPAHDAIVIFGGGAFDAHDPVFGGAQVVGASSGGLSLTNTGLNIIVRDAMGEFREQLTYGGSTGLNGDANQSLTRSPDITGSFVLHTMAAGAGGRRFSPGRKLDGSFFVPHTGHLTSINISPASASVIEGQTTQFTAQAFDQFGQSMTGITITVASNDTNVATVESATTDPSTGIATATVRGQNVGTAEIKATATDGMNTVMSSPAMLTVTTAPPVISRVEVAPSSVMINRGATEQFTATAFDQNDQPVTGVTFTWTSSDANVATVDANGLASGAGMGTATITATAPNGSGGTVSDDATLIAQVPLLINEILADVPPDNPATTAIEGDSNRDGVRNSDDDEFIELFNISNSAVNISGVIISDATSNRFTFPANTTLAAGRAVIVFGGGTPPVNDPAFGGALIFTTSSLGKNDGGDTVTVKLPVSGTDVTIDSLMYGTGSPIPAPSDQSLTRSPDAEVGSTGGSFVAHTTVTNAAGRVFSPGTRADGTPFGSPSITRIEVTPSSATIDIGGTQTFMARAFSNAGGPEVEVQNVSFIWDASDPSKATIAPTTGASTTATGNAAGNPTIRARAGGQQGTATLTINPPPPVLTSVDISPDSASVIEGQTTQFTAQAFDQFGQPMTGITITVASNDTNVATVESATTDPDTGIATATVRGQMTGMAEIKATATDGTNTVMSSPAQLTVTIAPPMVSRVEVLPSSATINRGATEQFTATAFDQNDQPVTGVTFTWSSSNTVVATVDSNGLATGHGIGTATITATTSDGSGGTVSDDATLNVQVPLLINEALVQVPLDNPGTSAIEGDANRDGVRSSDDDELVELFNNSNAQVDISGVIISDATSNRFTFPANTTLAAGRAVIVFGGGSPPVNDPAFGGALIFTTGSLSLADGGDTVTVKLPVGGTDVTIDSLAYGTGNPVPAPGAQSLTRSPDAEVGSTGGGFVAHTTVTNAAGRVFSPGTRTDGTPFGSQPITRIEVAPPSATINVGATQAFSARAFSNAGGPELEIQNVSFIWDASDTSKATVAPITGETTTATGMAAGSATIRARAGGQQSSSTLMIEAVVTSVELMPESTSVTVGNSVTFTATARDGGGNSIPGITFAFSLRDQSPANAASITNMTANTVTVRGDMVGSVTVVASYTRASDNMTLEDTSALTIDNLPPPPVPTAGQVIVNEAVVAFATSTTQTRHDFLELYNTTSQVLDISGLVISFRPPGNGNTPSTVTLPGAVGSGSKLIQPGGYFLIAGGADTFGVTADFDASSVGFDLNNTTGGIKIEINSVKLDGLSYQSGATPPASPFNTYGEGAIFTFTGGTTNDLIRSPNANDTGDNLSDFRRNGVAANVTPKAPNPTLFFSDVTEDDLISFVDW